MESNMIEIFFEYPLFLWSLTLLPLVILFGMTSKYEIQGIRKTSSIFFRVFLLFLVILSLAGLQTRVQQNKGAMVYLVDVSDSIQKEQLQQTVDMIQKSQEKASAQDISSVICFSSEVSVLLPFHSKKDFKISLAQLEERRNSLDGKNTNIASALSFARAFFPPGYQKKILLFSDGNETVEEALSQARIIKGEGIELVSFGLLPPVSTDLNLRIHSIQLSQQQARIGEGIKGKLLIQSNHEVEGTLKIYKNGLLKEERKKVKIKAGLNDPNQYTFQDVLYDKGINLYEVEFLTDKEQNKKTHKANAIVYGYSSKLRVLLVEMKEEDAAPLKEGLAKENILVDWVPPQGLGPDLYSYDVVIISDVAVNDLQTSNYNSDEIMAMIKDYVRKGGGFVMIGGENSFGLGGYMDTDIEKILPINMDIPKKIELPSIAIALVIDKSGSMSSMRKMELAKEASVKVVELLKPQDWILVIPFDSQYYVTVDVQQATGKTEIIKKIRTIEASGGTYIYPALEQAYQRLSKLNRAKIKHIILLTDGITQQADHKTLSENIRKAGITLSCVAVGRGSDVSLLKNMAEVWGGGRFYFTENSNNIPRIFTQETIKISKSSIVDEPFKPILGIPMQYLEGMDWANSPELLSYVVTRPKKTSIVSLLAPSTDSPEGKPLLATWQVGLGKTAAFTSDAKQRWAAGWLDWEGFPKFWAQVMRYVGKKKINANFQIKVQELGNKARFMMDAADVTHEFMNARNFELLVFRFEKGKSQEKPEKVFSFSQKAPGRYEVEIADLLPGYYAAVLKEKEKPEELQSIGFSVTDHLEKMKTDLNPSLLLEISSMATLHPEPEKIWEVQSEQKAFEQKMMWPFLLILALFLLPLDIAVRRISWRTRLQKIPDLPLRPLEIFIRSTAALVAFVGSGWLSYYLMQNNFDPIYWIYFQELGIEVHLLALGTAILASLLFAFLGWRYSLRERLF